MPVIGHAFVGLATAMCTRPRRASLVGVALWTPVVVGLAYLPDVVRQVVASGDAAEKRLVTHSLPCAVAAALVAAPGLARLGRRGFAGGFAIALGLILSHVVLDILQGSDRRFWWPFSNAHVRLNSTLIPTSTRQEAVLFAKLFGVFIGVRWIAMQWWRRRHPPAAGVRGRGLAVWTGYGLTAVIFLAAGTTHYLRGVRQQDLAAANRLLWKGRYAESLAMVERADRWPRAATPARMDYARAEAYAGLKQRDLAEYYFLRSIEADPTFFWSIGDLAVLYASGEEPVEERQKKVEPYRRLLETRFSDHAHLGSYLKRIERKLAAPATRPRK